jgi:phage tail-like protein
MHLLRRSEFLYGVVAAAGIVALLFATTGRTEAAAKKDNGGPYSFKVEIDGVISGGFKEISGLESEVEVIEYKDGSDPITHKRAGKTKYSNIVLKRGFVNDASLLEWYKKVLAGTTDRKSGSVIYLDRAGQEVLRYNFFEAWPCRWKAPELNSNSDTRVLMEEIEFCVEKVERA